MSKKEKGDGILIPILSVLDGLVLVGTAGIVAFGMATAQVGPERPTAKLADACRIISTIQRDANEAVLENISVPVLEEPAPVAEVGSGMSETTPEPQAQAGTTQTEEASLGNANIPLPQKDQPEQKAERQKDTPVNQAAQQNNASKSNTPTPIDVSPAAKSGSPGDGSGNADNFYTHDNPQLQQTDAAYVLNTSSKKFHIPSCRTVRQMAEKNYQEFNGTRDEAISNGYNPCGVCNP